MFLILKTSEIISISPLNELSFKKINTELGIDVPFNFSEHMNSEHDFEQVSVIFY